MKIAIATEMNMFDKVPEGFTNMRVEFCWAKMLDATFVPIHHLTMQYLTTSTGDNNPLDFDCILFILPKKTRIYDSLPIHLKRTYPNIKIGIIQEGPITLYQDWKPMEQLGWCQSLSFVDIVFVHNNADKEYITNLVPIKDCRVIPSVIDYDLIKNIQPPTERKGIILSGNFSSWYGGMHGLLLAMKYRDLNYPQESISIPGSGRITDEERKFCKENNITILPWTDWYGWMVRLNNFRLGINLMPTRAAGTFSRDCQALLIPCIGFNDLDTQVKLHPDLCVNRNLSNIKEVITKIKTNNYKFGDINEYKIETHRDRILKILEEL